MRSLRLLSSDTHACEDPQALYELKLQLDAFQPGSWHTARNNVAVSSSAALLHRQMKAGPVGTAYIRHGISPLQY